MRRERFSQAFYRKDTKDGMRETHIERRKKVHSFFKYKGLSLDFTLRGGIFQDDSVSIKRRMALPSFLLLPSRHPEEKIPRFFVKTHLKAEHTEVEYARAVQG